MFVRLRRYRYLVNGISHTQRGRYNFALPNLDQVMRWVGVKGAVSLEVAESVLCGFIAL